MVCAVAPSSAASSSGCAHSDCALYVCDVLGVEVSKHDRDFLVRRCNGPYFDVQTHGGLVVLFSEQDSDEVFGFLAGKALIRIGDDGKAIQ